MPVEDIDDYGIHFPVSTDVVSYPHSTPGSLPAICQGQNPSNNTTIANSYRASVPSQALGYGGLRIISSLILTTLQSSCCYFPILFKVNSIFMHPTFSPNALSSSKRKLKPKAYQQVIELMKTYRSVIIASPLSHNDSLVDTCMPGMLAQAKLV